MSNEKVYKQVDDVMMTNILTYQHSEIKALNYKRYESKKTNFVMNYI